MCAYVAVTTAKEEGQDLRCALARRAVVASASSPIWSLVRRSIGPAITDNASRQSLALEARGANLWTGHGHQLSALALIVMTTG